MTSDLMRSDRSRRNRPNGFSLVECLVVMALLGILATLAIPRSSAVQWRLELNSGLRRLRVGLDRGRMTAEQDRQPCALQLTATGWQPPPTGDLPDAVRFSSNGVVLDGGLVVLSHPSHAQAFCLVIGLPLGISRTGVYRGDPSGSLSSALCLPSDA